MEVFEDIIDTILIHSKITDNFKISDFWKIVNRIKGRKVSFETNASIDNIHVIPNTEYTITVEKIELILVNNNEYRVCFFDKKNIYHVDTLKEIKVIGRRIKSSADPYGEEDWNS